MATDSTLESTHVGMSLERIAFARQQGQWFEIMRLKRNRDRVPMISRLVDPLRLARDQRVATYMAINRDPAVSGLYFVWFYGFAMMSFNEVHRVSHA